MITHNMCSSCQQPTLLSSFSVPRVTPLITQANSAVVPIMMKLVVFWAAFCADIRGVRTFCTGNVLKYAQVVSGNYMSCLFSNSKKYTSDLSVVDSRMRLNKTDIRLLCITIIL